MISVARRLTSVTGFKVGPFIVIQKYHSTDVLPSSEQAGDFSET